MHQHLAALLAEMIVLTLAVHKAAMPAFPAATDDLVTGKGSAAGEEKKREHLFFGGFLLTFVNAGCKLADNNGTFWFDHFFLTFTFSL